MNDNASSNIKNPDQILEKFLLETIVEQRRKRRWGIFFKLIFLALILFVMWGLFCPFSMSGQKSLEATHKKHIAKIEIFGEISADHGINAQDVLDALDDAEKDKNTQAIILDINSPGGSPVQASYIYHEIHRLQQAHKNIPIDAVCEDACASAAYYIASGARNIYADPTSLVGSIGVLMDGFGFVDTLQKVGVTRRLYTAGQNKGFLDPFSPVKPQDVQLVQAMLDSDHIVFINDVKAGRGNRLQSDPNLFSGLVWNGLQAKTLGLIDGFGSPLDVARDKYNNDNLVDFTSHKNYFQLIFDQFGAEFWHQFQMQMMNFHLK